MSRFNRDVMFSSATEEWETPQEVFDYLDSDFHFTLDPCATSDNAKCERFYTREDDGLKQNWGGETVFVNPPFSIKVTRPDGTTYRKRVIQKWVRKAYLESLRPNTTVVMLIPARTDTAWFHDYCARGKIWFIRGRLKFGGATTGAPFPSMIVIFGENK